jgi:hypothetical protein
MRLPASARLDHHEHGPAVSCNGGRAAHGHNCRRIEQAPGSTDDHDPPAKNPALRDGAHHRSRRHSAAALVVPRSLQRTDHSDAILESAAWRHISLDSPGATSWSLRHISLDSLVAIVSSRLRPWLEIPAWPLSSSSPELWPHDAWPGTFCKQRLAYLDSLRSTSSGLRRLVRDVRAATSLWQPAFLPDALLDISYRVPKYISCTARDADGTLRVASLLGRHYTSSSQVWAGALVGSRLAPPCAPLAGSGRKAGAEPAVRELPYPSGAFYHGRA